MPPPTPLIASPKLLALLESLHSASLEQESKLNWAQLRNEPQDAFDTLMRDKYISLDQDKCELVYHLLRGKGATTIVEAGTSFGVSTIYLALAAAQNASRDALGSIKKGRVIATEKEETKARVARSTWAKAGEEIAGVIDLRIGDLRETLTSGLDNVDFLLLDIWTPLALPALKAVEPHFKTGAMIVVDNTIKAVAGYEKLFAYVDAPESRYRRITMPYDGGLDLIIYH